MYLRKRILVTGGAGFLDLNFNNGCCGARCLAIQSGHQTQQWQQDVRDICSPWNVHDPAFFLPPGMGGSPVRAPGKITWNAVPVSKLECETEIVAL